MSQNKKNAVNNNGNVVMTPASAPAAPAAFTFTPQQIAEFRARYPAPQGPMMPGAAAGAGGAGARGAFSNVYNAAVAAFSGTEKKKGGYKKLSSRKKTRRSKSRRRRA